MKVAYLTCCSYRVNRVCWAAMHAAAVRQVREACASVAAELLNIFEPATDDDTLRKQIDNLASQQPDVLILHYAGWTEDGTVQRIVDRFKTTTLLWATDDRFENGISQLVAHVGYMEASAFLKRNGYKFSRYFGGPDSESAKALTSYLKAAHTAMKVKTMRFGYFGEGFGAAGILDAVFDEQALKDQMGIEIQRVPLSVLFDRYQSITAEQVLAADSPFSFSGQNLAERVLQAAPDREIAIDSLRALTALWQITRERNFGAIAIRCFPEFKQNGIPVPCLSSSVLNEMGIPAACEGDILSGISMFVLSRLTGKPAMLMDVAAVNDQTSTMDLFHCGNGPVSLSCGGNSAELCTHCKPKNHRAGITVEFPLAQDHASFLKLDYIDGRFTLYYYTGQTVEPAQFLRGTYATVKTDSPARQVIDALLDEGVGHHVVLSLGEVAREVQWFSQLSNLELVKL
jgi:L-fucose isomerase-like protein